jgi:hypothetical protein
MSPYSITETRFCTPILTLPYIYVHSLVPTPTVAAPVMTIKNFLSMEEKPPDVIGRGPIASRYQVCTAHSFLLTAGSFKEFLLYLAQCLKRYSTARLVAVNLCHLAMLSSPTILNKEAAVVLAMTTSPLV